jgi:type IV pilus assembly protein PilW
MTSQFRWSKRHDGFSLVELMTMLIIELLVMGAAITVYLKVQDTYRTADSLGRLQENARHAMNLVEADVRMASFWGLHNQPGFNTINALSAFPANCGADWVTDTASYITGQNNAYSLPCAAAGGGAQPDSDVLIVRRASAQRISPQSAIVATVNRDRVLIVSNPLAGEIFVPKDIGDSIPPGYATADPANAPPAADTRALLVNAYYVSRNSSVSPGYPALRRKRLSAGPSITDEELLPGVEDLQFEIGVDTTGDANVDVFVNPDAVPAGGTPVSVRLWLRLRAQDSDRQLADTPAGAYADRSWPATDDGYRRLLVHKTLRLRNVSW